MDTPPERPTPEQSWDIEDQLSLALEAAYGHRLTWNDVDQLADWLTKKREGATEQS